MFGLYQQGGCDGRLGHFGQLSAHAEAKDRRMWVAVTQTFTNPLPWTMRTTRLSSAMEELPCQRITDNSWKTSGRRPGSPSTSRLLKCRPHGRTFFDKGEQERGEVQAHVGCTKEEDELGLDEGGEEAWNLDTITCREISNVDSMVLHVYKLRH